MRRPLVFAVFLAACSSAGIVPTPTAGERTDGSIPGAEPTPKPREREGGACKGVRIMAANVTSVLDSTYDPEESLRLFQGLHADVALVQEMTFGDNSDTDLARFVTAAFGEGFNVYREPEGQIPNGIVSRYPILEAGDWDDPEVADRGFAWAKIAISSSAPVNVWAAPLLRLPRFSSAIVPFEMLLPSVSIAAVVVISASRATLMFE